MGARNDGMRNVCELLINVVIFDRPKMLTGLDQKVRGNRVVIAPVLTPVVVLSVASFA